VTQRLTKPHRRCKATLCTVALLLSGASLGDTADRSLRDCVSKAAGTAAVSACERSHQARLKDSIARLTEAIRSRLDAKQRLILDKSTAAWKEFQRRERSMLTLSLGMRKDGLGPKLELGSVTRLYEQREQQLREHLHNLSLAPPVSTAPDSR